MDKYQIESTIVFVLLVLLVAVTLSFDKEVILAIDDNGTLYNAGENWAGGGDDEIGALMTAGILFFPAMLLYFFDLFTQNKVKIIALVLAVFFSWFFVDSILDYELKYINVVHGSFKMRLYIIVLEIIKLYVIIKVIIKMKRMADNR